MNTRRVRGKKVSPFSPEGMIDGQSQFFSGWTDAGHDEFHILSTPTGSIMLDLRSLEKFEAIYVRALIRGYVIQRFQVEKKIPDDILYQELYLDSRVEKSRHAPQKEGV